MKSAPAKSSDPVMKTVSTKDQRLIVEALQETVQRLETLLFRGDLASSGDADGDREERATRAWLAKTRAALKVARTQSAARMRVSTVQRRVIEGLKRPGAYLEYAYGRQWRLVGVPLFRHGMKLDWIVGERTVVCLNRAGVILFQRWRDGNYRISGYRLVRVSTQDTK